MISKQALTDKLKRLSSKNGLGYNTLQTTYFFERFLKRISVSKYKNNFVVKGGFLLASIVGIEFRSTIDMDFSLREEIMKLSRLEEMLNQIVKIDLNDCITYEIEKNVTIRPDDLYGGYSFKIIGKFENIIVPFWVDIATGDPITPQAFEYQYKTLIFDENIQILSYTLETIIAEKLHTIVSKQTGNSRSKDFYDIYILMKIKYDKIDIVILKRACIRTFAHRNTEFNYINFLSVLNRIKEEKGFVERWNTYAKNNIFAKEIKFSETLEAIYKLLEVLFKHKLEVIA